MIVDLNKIIYTESGILKQVNKKEIGPIGKLIEYLIERDKTKRAKNEKEMDEEFNKGVNGEGNEVIELTDEEQNDLDEIFNIVDIIRDKVAKTIVGEYFKIKERRERRNEYDE